MTLGEINYSAGPAALINPELRFAQLWCWDTEDVEGWLVEEGIGYFDSSGIFHYGDDPNAMTDDPDIPRLSDFEEER